MEIELVNSGHLTSVECSLPQIWSLWPVCLYWTNTWQNIIENLWKYLPKELAFALMKTKVVGPSGLTSAGCLWQTWVLILKLKKMVPSAHNYSGQHSDPGSSLPTNFSSYMRHHLRMEYHSFIQQSFIGHLLCASYCAGSQDAMVNIRGQVCNCMKFTV